MSGKTLIGVERDRAVIRGVALKIIRMLTEHPHFKDNDRRKDWLAPPPLNAFRRLEPLGFGLSQDDQWLFRPEDCPPDLVWPLSVGVADACGFQEGISVKFSRIYTVTMKQVRGYASIFSPFMVRNDHAIVDRGKLLTAASIQAWRGGAWVEAQKRTLWSGRDADHAIPEKLNAEGAKQGSISTQCMTSLALRQRYEWSVALGFEHTPTIRFATDPTGIKDVFRIRDLPEGRDRREALMTWVSDHWRQDRNDPDLERYVRKHLRGATSFTWRGMECELVPSQFDIEQRDKFIAEREAMRAKGADVRQVI